MWLQNYFLFHLQVAITKVVPYPHLQLVADFQSRTDLIQALMASCHIPYYLNGQAYTGKVVMVWQQPAHWVILVCNGFCLLNIEQKHYFRSNIGGQYNWVLQHDFSMYHVAGILQFLWSYCSRLACAYCRFSRQAIYWWGVHKIHSPGSADSWNPNMLLPQ